MEARDATLEPHLSKLDQITGMSFKQQFSFAVAGHLLKGLRHATTKTTTTRVLSTLIDVCRENVGANVLGYLAALLPHRGDDMHLRFQTGYVWPARTRSIAELIVLIVNLTLVCLFTRSLESADSNHQLLFNAQMVPDKMNAALLFTFLATILKGTLRPRARFILLLPHPDSCSLSQLQARTLTTSSCSSSSRSKRVSTLCPTPSRSRSRRWCPRWWP